jgi:F-type H+-transporting ATPase subunit b
VQVLNFLILVAILTKLAYKPVMKLLEQRQEQIKNDLDSAHQENLSAAQLKQEYLDKLNDARLQAQSILEKAEKTAEQVREEILKDAKEESAKLLKAARDEINRERDKAINELRTEVVTLSVAAASKIIGQNMDGEINAKLVDDFIKNLDKEKIGGLPC